MRDPSSWDIFCRVVDNFGDAGVCWRLARQLANEHRARVRLFIDDLPSLERLHPAIERTARQRVDAVEVWRWQDGCEPSPDADVVIEAFGCGLPEPYVNAMTRAARPPLWIVLEYLSAEPWVPAHHGLPSPHPRGALERYFFFPGVVAGTGGVLREADLFTRRDAFDAAARARYWRSAGFGPPRADAIVVSVFAYAQASMRELLDAWTRNDRPIVAAVPDGPALIAALEYFGAESSGPRVLSRGVLELRVVPFAPQAHYDALLWACDCNFVRGEDSFVRAQWAARPFVWQAYRQPERAHHPKLEAFLALYEEGLGEAARTALRDMTGVWNQNPGGEVTVHAAWAAFSAQLPALRQHAAAWSAGTAAVGDLAGNLARFCSEKLK